MKQTVIKKSRILSVIVLFALVFFTGTFMISSTASATSSGNSSIPAGCIGGPAKKNASPPSNCPKLVKSKSDCSASQTATQATNGEWYCIDASVTAGGGNNSGNNQTATTIWQNSGIPDGCPGNPNLGPPQSNCPQLKQNEKDLHCSSNQTPTKLISGPKSGYWYCNGGSNSSGGGGGSAAGSALGGIGSGTGCVGGSSACGQQCGAPDQDPYTPAIDIGCRGKGNPIMDATFGIIRFLSDGVGLVVIGSIVYAGIQYTGSRGDPQSTAMAINRIRSSLFALLIYIFAYAMLNYLIPGAVLQ